MNTTVALASLASSTAIAAPVDLNGSSGDMLARAEEVVSILRTWNVCEGWKLDEVRAEHFLKYFRDGAPDNDRWQEAAAWIHEHGQSIDWIAMGNVVNLVAGAAARSPRAAAITPVDPIFAAIEAHREANAAYAKANEAPARMLGKHHPVRICVGYSDDELSVKNGKDGSVTLTLTRGRGSKKRPIYAYDHAGIERSVPRDLEGAAREAWIAERAAELEAEERRIAKAHAKTKLGKLEAIADRACDLGRDRLWDLIWTKPTTTAGLAALFQYFRTSTDDFLGGGEWRDALDWTMECAACDFAGLPAPPMSDVVAELWKGAEQENVTVAA
jgi:hypothetical protein